MSENEIKDYLGLIRYAVMYKDYEDLDKEKLCDFLIAAFDMYLKEKENNSKYIVQLTDPQYRRLVDIIREETNKEWQDKIKEHVQVFKKEGSQTSLIIASVLEDLLKEN